MTKEELIDAACEIIGCNTKELSADQTQALMTIIERLADLSLDQRRSFDNLCTIRTIIAGAATPPGTADDLVTLRLTEGQRAFLLTLIDKEIREHA